MSPEQTTFKDGQTALTEITSELTGMLNLRLRETTIMSNISALLDRQAALAGYKPSSSNTESVSVSASHDYSIDDSLVHINKAYEILDAQERLFVSQDTIRPQEAHTDRQRRNYNGALSAATATFLAAGAYISAVYR
ncbi:MAG: hypothetical protein Q8O89_08100 [Nanoarchaeota archaeon]|nr:hypothetical protein [Nanoarchaeota archaeon]